MNIILLEKSDFINNAQVIIKDKKKFKHILKVLKANVGDSIKIGLINDLLGIGIISNIDKTEKTIVLEVELNKKPPKKINTTLILAMVRPKSLKKALHIAIAMGIKNIIIIKTWKVDKSYWSSPILFENSLNEIAIEALEQAKDTIMPKIIIKKLFKPFIEDELSPLMETKRGIVAHPIAQNSFFDINTTLSDIDYLAIGPEGGFIDYEIDKFKNIGFEVLKLNERILRVEYAIPVILSRLISK